MNDAGKSITETGMNETIPRSTTGEGTTAVKGTRTSNAIKRQDIFVEKSVKRQPEITTKGQAETPRGQHRKTVKQKKPAW